MNPVSRMIVAVKKIFQTSRLAKKLEEMGIWEDLIPGQIVRYKGQELVFLGIDKEGGPGNPGVPEPKFGSIPPDPKCIYYIRNTTGPFPDVPEETSPPVQEGGWTMSIKSLNATRQDFEVIGHIAEEQYKHILTPA